MDEKINSLEKKVLKPVDREKLLKETLEYFKGDYMARDQWIRKYSLKDSKGNIYESNPAQMHERISKEIFRIEEMYEEKSPSGRSLSYDQIYGLLKNFNKIVLGGSNMSGIGNNLQYVSLSNCFVIGNTADSYGGIMNIDEQQAQLMKRRGGVGHDLSHIRPSGSNVNNSALTSTGVVPFMERYSNTTNEVAQDGRRGALMLSIDIRHPDSEDFIDSKMIPGKITGANISVKLNNEFMEAVKYDKPFVQKYPINSENPEYSKEINARKLWEKIINNAWKSAEPGILFWDNIKNESLADCYSKFGFESTSTNPCGEIPLCPYDSCRLLSLNLYSYVENPFTEKAKFKMEEFKRDVGYATRIMDNIIDLEQEKIKSILEKIEKDPEEKEFKRVEKEMWIKILQKTEEGRRTGIGITAEGDMIAAMNLRYGTDDATDFAEEVHKNHAIAVYTESAYLAGERGTFKIYDPELEKNNPFLNRLRKASPELSDLIDKNGRRNISSLTIAPNGTISIMTQTTSGIEPLYLPAYKRNVKVEPKDKDTPVTFVDKNGIKWFSYNVIHQPFKKWLEVTGQDSTQLDNIENLEELVQKGLELAKNSPYFKATSNDIDWIKKVEMQGRIQKWVDHSISATTNMPKGTSKEIVEKAYIRAWEVGCKGHTVYVDGSRGDAVLSSNNNLETRIKFPEKRPETLEADVWRFKNINENGGEDWIAFVGKIDNRPIEIFTGMPSGDILYLPPKVNKGLIKKVIEIIPAEKTEDGKEKRLSRYDFIYKNKVGFLNTIEGISHQFNREFWNYARLVSSHMKEGTPLLNIIKIVKKLKFDVGENNINSWINGVIRSIKNYIPDDTYAGDICGDCKSQIVFQGGCETCGCGPKCG